MVEREVRLETTLDANVYDEIRELAEGLGVTPEELTSKLLEILSSYKGIIVELASKLRVRREHKADSVFEELVYYGVEAWRGILEPTLRLLRASGRFELEMLEFDPAGPAFEMEFVALEGSDLKADRVRLYWTMEGVTMEVYYYLEEGEEPPQGPKTELEWDYLPDEHAVVATFRARSITELPPIHAVDRMMEAILPA